MECYNFLTIVMPSSISDKFYQQFYEDLVITCVLNLPCFLVTKMYSLVVVGVVPWTEQILLLNQVLRRETSVSCDKGKYFTLVSFLCNQESRLKLKKQLGMYYLLK